MIWSVKKGAELSSVHKPKKLARVSFISNRFWASYLQVKFKANPKGVMSHKYFVYIQV
jgi:hypothetical protein